MIVAWALLACTIIIGTNTTNLDRDSGIILEKDNETNANEEERNEKEDEKEDDS